MPWEDDKETDDGEYWRVLHWGWSGSGRHKFTRDLRLRRIDKEITKAVEEKRWKDADELEAKYQWAKTVQDQHAAKGPSIAEQDHFARRHTEPLLTPGGRPQPNTNDEYVEDPEMIRVIEDRWQRTGKDRDDPRRPPKRPRGLPTGYGGSNKKGNSGPRHGQAEGEPDPTRHGQLPPGPSSPIRPEPCPVSGRCMVCRKCSFISSYYDPNAIDCMYWDSAID